MHTQTTYRQLYKWSPAIPTCLPIDYYKPNPEHKIETEREREGGREGGREREFCGLWWAWFRRRDNVEVNHKINTFSYELTV